MTGLTSPRALANIGANLEAIQVRND